MKTQLPKPMMQKSLNEQQSLIGVRHYCWYAGSRSSSVAGVAAAAWYVWEEEEEEQRA